MSDMKRRFKLKLGGNEYTIIGNTTPKKMDAVSRLLNEQLAEISKQMPSLSTEKRQYFWQSTQCQIVLKSRKNLID